MKPPYRVTKRFSFCYGHRLMDYDGNCRHPHGHNARVEVDLASARLDRRGMVVDFHDLKASLRGWIDATLDHRMILRRDDPMIGILRGMGEPFYAMPLNPTAENLARLVYERARLAGLPVARVTFWETDDNCAVYEPPARRSPVRREPARRPVRRARSEARPRS